MGKIATVLLLLGLRYCPVVWSQTPKSFNFVIVREPEQNRFTEMVPRLIREIESEMSGSVKINDNYVVIQQDSSDDQFCQVINSGISAIIDLSHTGHKKELAKLEGIRSMPYFHVDVTLQTFAHAMDAYIVNRTGQDTIFIVTNEEEMDDVLYHVIQKSRLRVLVIDGLDDVKLKKLDRIRPYPSYFSLIGPGATLQQYYEMINEAKLIKVADKWNFMLTDFDESEFHGHVQHPQIHRLVMDKSICCAFQQGSSRSRCECGKFSLQEAHLKNFMKTLIPPLMNNNHISVKYDCNTVLNSSSTEMTSTTQSPLHSELLTAIKSSSLMSIDGENQMTVRYSYNFSAFTSYSNTSMTQSLVATIKDGQVMPANGLVIQSTRRYFRIGVVDNAIPWSYILRDKNGKYLLDEKQQPIWDGYCIEFTQRLAERMNFDYELVMPKTGRFGKKYSNDKWDGLIGDLYTGDTDLVVAPLKMTAQREEVIDFVTPFYEQTGILIMMRNPVVETSLFKFMTVLRLEVWLSIIAALVATSIMLWLLDTYSPYSSRNNKDAYPYPCREFTLKESFWFTLTSFTPQGGGEAPKSLSARTLVAAYWLFVVLMLATFTANLAAFLTVERMKTPVQSLEQLARQSRINYTVVEGSDVHQFFINMKFAEDTLYRMWKELTLNSSTDELQYRIWEYPIKEQYGNILLAINDSIPVKTADEGYVKVNEAINADFAFIHDAAEIKYQIARNCNFTQVGEVFAEQPYALAIQQGSHIHDELSRHIIELQHERFFELLTAKYWNNSLKGYCPNSDESEGITLESLGGVFIATLFGLGLAMLTLIGEVIYHRRIAKREEGIQQVRPVDIAGLSTPPTLSAKVSPSPPSYIEAFKNLSDDKKQFGKTVTLGGNKFVPASKKNKVAIDQVLRENSNQNARLDYLD